MRVEVMRGGQTWRYATIPTFPFLCKHDLGSRPRAGIPTKIATLAPAELMLMFRVVWIYGGRAVGR
jgi:hypothetical protein